MKLTISHTTTYDYEEPVPYGLLQLRLTPKTIGNQRVESWRTAIAGASRQVRFDDHFANAVELVRLDADSSQIQVTASGEVETTNTDGVFSSEQGSSPLWLFLRDTPLTSPGAMTTGLIKDLPVGFTDLSVAHELAARVRDAIDYEPGATTVDVTAEEAMTRGRGVCQDHAHVFLAAARLIELPARYVSGYLLLDDTSDQQATHAWAEAWIEDLGWVGFDISNRMCPDERYVRVAIGLDYREASPISGIRFGSGNENLQVDVQVQQ